MEGWRRTLLGVFGRARQEPTGFEYGWCTTDGKDGKKIREDWRATDFMFNRPYAARVRKMLERLGLPWPKKSEIFRGTHHDLLFLNSHGIVVRIGPLDVQDLINPAILQPLGWLEDKSISTEGNTHLTIAVYPGVELLSHWGAQKEKPPIVGDVARDLEEMSQSSRDAHSTNMGIIRILDDEVNERSVPMLIDSDNEFNHPLGDLARRRKSAMAQSGQFLENRADIMASVIEGLFDSAVHIKPRIQAFRAHQPLRRMFFEAFKDVNNPDPAMRALFWAACARAVNNPQSMEMPVWQSKMGPDGKLQFFREEICVPVVLYRPWTGAAADKVIQPIRIDPTVKIAVAKAHAKLKEDAMPKVASASHTM